MDFDLKNILKALLISTSEPISIKDVQGLFKRFQDNLNEDKENEEQEDIVDNKSNLPSMLTVAQVRDAFDTLMADVEENETAYRVVETSEGYQIVVTPEYSNWIRLHRNETRPLKLSNAALEVLAIIAYKQPVTKAEMEAIRGVTVDAGVHKLIEHELIQVLGRADLPGRPLQYGTTSKFLDFCGLKSIEELPASDVISPNMLNDWIKKATTEESPEIQDKDVGLPNN